MVTESILPRKLWYLDDGKQVSVDHSFLTIDPRSLIVLGEAGMGKSTLLSELHGVAHHKLCTARWLVNSSNPAALLGDATTLVIDALDEVPAHRNGDAVDRILQKLDQLGKPRFILSCRVADWRSATALQGISEFYNPAPLELHLEPLDRTDALAFLSTKLGEQRAGQVIDHLEQRGLSDLWSNPQTLKLVAEIAIQGELPESKGDLFERATKLLQREHRSDKETTALAEMAGDEVLDAAGAGFAALILTGADALTRRGEQLPDDLAIQEVARLPTASRIGDVLSSRLFSARGPDRFTYAHRAIGEYLGARWLVRTADTPRKQRRLLGLFNNAALIPASLRGIHGWLAWHSSALAPAVIAADPMGVIEYGDADSLSPEKARALLSALGNLSKDNPGFRDFAEYRVAGLVQRSLLPEVRAALADPKVEYGLRLLLLQALKNSTLIAEVADVLKTILLDANDIYDIRRGAAELLTLVDPSPDWQSIVEQLRTDIAEENVRLPLDVLETVSFDKVSDALLLEVVVSQLPAAEKIIGIFPPVGRDLPTDRLDTLLDGIAAAATARGDKYSRPDNNAITDQAYSLLADRLPRGDLDAGRVWAWMRPFNSHYGYRRELRDVVAHVFREDETLRRAVQQRALLDDHEGASVLHRSAELSDRSAGLTPSEDDTIRLLETLGDEDPRWRDVVLLVPHSTEQGAAVRGAASRFVTNSAENAAWLERLAHPQKPTWEIQQEERRRVLEEEREQRRRQERAEFGAQIQAIRTGEYGWILAPAQAYFGLLIDQSKGPYTGPERLEEWLGSDLRDACLEGFEAFLTESPPNPTATSIAESHALGRYYDAGFIIVAALAERTRSGRGLDDLPDERLMAGLFHIRRNMAGDLNGVPTLAETLAENLRHRGAWEETQRLSIEPQLARHQKYPDGFFELLRDPRDEAFATAFAEEWLTKDVGLPEETEIEFVDRLLTPARGHEALRAMLPARRHLSNMSDERRRTWAAIGLIVDFDTTRAALESAGEVDRELLWHIRERLGGRYSSKPAVHLDVHQSSWIVRTFRKLWPVVTRPKGPGEGDTNPWDACDYLAVLINRLGDQVTDEAIEALTELRDAPADGYTRHLRVATAEQQRKKVEADWRAPDFATVMSAVSDVAPTAPSQLQAVVLEELDVVQRKVRGSDVDWYRDFFSGDGAPRIEEDCRDTVLKMLDLPFDIQAAPEGHMADDKRCDIVCSLGKIIVPIEIKGQWNSELWTAADHQLDRQYTNDWRAERGIYLVLWFGRSSKKKPYSTPRGVLRPETAEDLRKALHSRSKTAQEGRTTIVVLDLTRPA